MSSFWIRSSLEIPQCDVLSMRFGSHVSILMMRGSSLLASASTNKDRPSRIVKLPKTDRREQEFNTDSHR